MKTLSSGARGPQVQLLQLALRRAGYGPGPLDGSFGARTAAALRAFQTRHGLAPDGIAGPLTHAALRPWYTGHVNHTIRPGDTIYRLANLYAASARAIETANPALDPLRLPVGAELTIPFPFPVTPFCVDWCSTLLAFCCEGLKARYPFLGLGGIGSSVLGRPLWRLTLGEGGTRVLFNAAHHANEWITTPLLLRYTELLARAAAFGEPEAAARLRDRTLSVLPCVDPDGMDLVTGDLDGSEAWERARTIAAGYPAIPFPDGWKANLEGVDLNLQYPAGWETAREIKFAQGFVGPAPRDFVGPKVLSAPESRAVYDYTRQLDPALTVSLHTQGEVIFWRYQDHAPEGARELVLSMARASGYAVDDAPYASGYAGYKDWFLDAYDRPGFTVELGRGENPLPVSDARDIYPRLRGLLNAALDGAG